MAVRNENSSTFEASSSDLCLAGHKQADLRREPAPVPAARELMARVRGFWVRRDLFFLCQGTSLHGGMRLFLSL